MSWIRRGARVAGLVAALAMLGGWLTGFLQAGSRAPKQAAFGSRESERAHQLMLAQVRHLQSVLLGFLTANDDLVIANSEAIANGISQIAKSEVFNDGQPEEWRAVAELAQAAAQTAQRMQERKPVLAHEQFQRMVRTCIACHDARRTANELPALKLPSTPDQ